MDLRKESLTIVSQLADFSIPYYLPKLILIPTGECNYHSSSKKPLASGDHQRKPQLDATERRTDCGEPNPNGYIHITAPVSTVQRTSRQKDCKRQKSVTQQDGTFLRLSISLPDHPLF